MRCRPTESRTQTSADKKSSLLTIVQLCSVSPPFVVKLIFYYLMWWWWCRGLLSSSYYFISQLWRIVNLISILFCLHDVNTTKLKLAEISENLSYHLKSHAYITNVFSINAYVFLPIVTGNFTMGKTNNLFMIRIILENVKNPHTCYK